MGRIIDKLKRSWDIPIDLVTLERVKNKAGANLIELVLPDPSFKDRLADPIWRGCVLQLICQDQCLEKGINAEDFLRALDVDILEDGFDAILEGVVSFSPRASRPAFEKVLEKARKYRTAQENQIREVATSPSFDAALEKAMTDLMNLPPSLPTESSTAAESSVESSELIQAS